MERGTPIGHGRAALAFVALVVVMSFAAACGGGGGGLDPGTDPGTTAPAVVALLRADLSGAEETSVTDASASGTILVELRTDSTIAFAAVAENPWLTEIVGMHIHRGNPGANGPIVVDLESGGASFDPGTGLASGELPVDRTLFDEIVASPTSFYVNVHTIEVPNGFVRGQLRGFEPVALHAVLSGNSETVPVDATARAAIAATVDANRRVEFVLATGALPAGDVTGAHLHSGADGVEGPPVVGLDLAKAQLDAVGNTLTGDATVGLADLALVLFEPSAFFARIHTASAPAGLARGQLETGHRDLWATLRGSDEPVIVDAGARGGFVLRLESFTTGRMMLAVPPAQDIDAITMAHLHEGIAGSIGSPLVDLMSGEDFGTGASTGSAEGAVVLDRALFARLLARPSAFYANAHTVAAADGLVRGQLTDDPLTFTASLLGINELTQIDPLAGGAVKVIFDGMWSCSFLLSMARPDVPDLIAGHIHDGPAGVNGGPLIDLLGGDTRASGNVVTGEVAFTGRTFARIIAAPELFYANVHSLAAPGGVARGQLVRVTQDSPPTAVQYRTPVTYETGGSIEENAPITFGGAITLFDVNPGLPEGLRIHALTGAIYGQPKKATAAADYTVTASNRTGSVQTTVRVEVIDRTPGGLAYTTPVQYTVGVAIAPNTPTSTGGTITQFSVSPALPAGLKIDSKTGVISGTPSGVAAAANYTVTGSNEAGFTSAAVNITVSAVLLAPSGLSYTTPVTYSTGSPITANTPTHSGGTPTSWSVSPSLPAGLALSPTTGAISGTPTTVTAAADYTVTAANSVGSTQATVRITVVQGGPVSISYSNNPNIGYVKGGSFATMTPTVTGGTPTSWSVSPGLPSGVSLNTSTGVISGAPSVTSNSTNYTVTASNAAGSAQTTITITVYP